MQQVRNMPGGAVAGEGNRAYETEPANWKPLENRIGSRCAEFMWMFRQNGLEYYKHIDTPRYLILDQKGRCYCRTGDRLVRTAFRKHFRLVTRAICSVD
jgi:hypothetical protein